MYFKPHRLAVADFLYQLIQVIPQLKHVSAWFH